MEGGWMRGWARCSAVHPGLPYPWLSHPHPSPAHLVMRHQQHRACVGLQRGGQRLHAFQVQMVGRLVQDQQVRPRKEDGSQRHAHRLATWRGGEQDVGEEWRQARESAGRQGEAAGPQPACRTCTHVRPHRT